MKIRFGENTYTIKSLVKRADFYLQLEKHRDKIKNHLVFEDGNKTVYTSSPCLELSKGCRACKNGTWLCVFVGYDCNASCKFCPQDKSDDVLHSSDHPLIVGEQLISDVKFYIDKFDSNIIEGVSYSGGEPLMFLEKVLDIANFTTQRRPNVYQWIYTNGILVSEDILKKLSASGIKEIRFDLAATSFNERILAKLEMSKKIIGKVTVEVPSIPEVSEKLIKNNILATLVDYGVDQLNLAELLLAQPINWETYAVDQDIYVFEDKISTLYSPTYSRLITLHIMQHAIKNKLDILINDCSLDAKQVQRVMREYKSRFLYF